MVFTTAGWQRRIHQRKRWCDPLHTWGNWAPKFANDKLLLGFSNTLGDADQDVRNGASTRNDGYTFWSGSLYAKYQFTDIFSLAGRASYLHASDEANTLAFPGAGGGVTPAASKRGDSSDLFSYTLTAGFNLLENLLVRAEYRVDLGNDITGGTTGAGGLDGDNIAHTVAFQAVYTF
ncbi:MAG: outer membrane beta-barrel protein [Blastochloris sp.]|nr:outer membrane beta-barrel protein [Blastochloris sp.]